MLVRLLKGIDMQEKRHMGDKTHERRDTQGKRGAREGMCRGVMQGKRHVKEGTHEGRDARRKRCMREEMREGRHALISDIEFVNNG